MNPGLSSSRPAAAFRHGLAATVCLAAALLLAGCSTFEHEWQAARRLPRLEDDLAGRWEGTWRSKATGHNNQLRAVIATGTNGVYSTQFHARYKIGIFRFSFGYTVPLRAALTNDIHQFHGETDLGWLAGGLYRYEGSATGTNFFSTYRSKYDHGEFQLQRPARTRR
jgi:hypothetical protein